MSALQSIFLIVILYNPDTMANFIRSRGLESTGIQTQVSLPQHHCYHRIKNKPTLNHSFKKYVVILGCSWLCSLQTFISEVLEDSHYPDNFLFCLNWTKLVSTFTPSHPESLNQVLCFLLQLFQVFTELQKYLKLHMCLLSAGHSAIH